MNLMLHEKRLLATFVDAALIALFCFILSIPLGIPFFSYDYYLVISFTVLMFFYQFFTLLIFKNRTLGMAVVGIMVLSKNRENMNFKQIVLRSVSISIPILFFVNIGYVFLNRDSKTIFDEISNSVVVNTGINYQAKKNQE